MANQIHCITDMERREIHKCLLHMLKDIDYVCRKHNITYMLCGGTALGAVRHQGFIPWDDDLDISMPRAEYEKFISIMHNELGKYYDFSYPHSNNIDYPFLKIYKKGTKFAELFDDMSYEGLWVDVFPMEYAPDNVLIRYVKGKAADFLFHCVAASLMIAQKNNNETKNMYTQNWRRKLRYYIAIIIGYMLCFLSYKKIINIFDNFVRSERKTSMMTIPTGRAYYFGECLSTSVIFPVRSMKFCDMEINVYNDVHSYLSRLYGDYMQIPPEDKRERHYISDFLIEDDIEWKVADKIFHI